VAADPRASEQAGLAGDRLGLAIGLASPVFLAFVPILIALGFEGGVAVIPLVTARTAFAALAAWTLVAGSGRLRRPFELDPPLLAAAFAGLTIAPLAGFLAIEELGPTVYAAVFFLHVPLLALTVPLLHGAAPRPASVVTACTCVLGVALVSGLPSSPGVVTGLGLAAALLNAVAFVAMALILHRRGGTFDAMRFNAEAMTLALGVFLVIYVVAYADEPLTGHAILISALVAVVAWLPGRLLWTLSVQRLGARAAGTLTSLQPMLVAILGAILLNDALGTSQWTGIAVICGSVAAAQRFDETVAEREV